MSKKNDDKGRKNVVIGVLIAVVLVLAAGYTGIINQLTGGKVLENSDAKWNVYISKINEVSNGFSNKTATIKSDQLSADLAAVLDNSLDKAVYTVEVTNDGTLDAKINNIAFDSINNDEITCSFEGLDLNTDNVILKNGGTKTFKVTVGYKNSVKPNITDVTNHINMILSSVQKA